MDQFFQNLRKIQKKERSNSTLARVEESFYKDIHNYLNTLRSSAGLDPFSDEHYLLKDTQRIATEICERREHKIANAAVVNIHRSYHLFTGKPKFDLVDTTPLNLTREEEKFYFSLIDALTTHRRNISLDKLTDEESPVKEIKKVLKPIEEVKTTSKVETTPESDEVLDKLDKIKKAKVITDEKVEPIEKQILNSKKEAISKEKSFSTSKKEVIKEEDVSAIYNNNADDQFVDFESKKIAKAEENETILIFDNIDSIIGVDEKIYGPFRPQDLVVMPKINAKVFIKNRKGRIVKI